MTMIPPTTRGGALLRFLGLERNTIAVLSMVILVGMGEHLAERFLPIYLIALGGGALSIGLVNAMDNLFSALYSFPGGYLSDRLGTKRALLVFNLVAMVGYAVVILIPAWPAVLAGAVLFLSWSSLSMPATLSLIHRVLPTGKRTMGVSMHSLVRRLPMALGPLIGGAFIMLWGERDGVRLAFVLALLLAGVAALMQQRLIDDAPGADGLAAPSPEKNPFRLLGQMSSQLRELLATDILIRFCEQIPYAFVVVWCMKSIDAPVTAVQFGLLTTLEMATAVLVYIPVAWLADRGPKKPFVAATFAFFTLFPLALMFARSFWWLVPVFILRGLKEFGEPTRKSLILELSPAHCRAGMFGLYYLIRDAVVSLAAFGGALLWQLGPEFNFTAAFAFGVIGTVGYLIFGREPAGPATPSAH